MSLAYVFPLYLVLMYVRNSSPFKNNLTDGLHLFQYSYYLDLYNVLSFHSRDHRDTWKYVPEELVSGNYYPVNSRIFIKVLFIPFL